MTREEQVRTKQECRECKKDYTKCSRCPVMMKWVKELRQSRKDR